LSTAASKDTEIKIQLSTTASYSSKDYDNFHCTQHHNHHHHLHHHDPYNHRHEDQDVSEAASANEQKFIDSARKELDDYQASFSRPSLYEPQKQHLVPFSPPLPPRRCPEQPTQIDVCHTTKITTTAPRAIRELLDSKDNDSPLLYDRNNDQHYHRRHEPVDIPVQAVVRSSSCDSVAKKPPSGGGAHVSVIDVKYQSSSVSRPTTLVNIKPMSPADSSSEHNYDIVDYENNYLIELPPPAPFKYQNSVSSLSSATANAATAPVVTDSSDHEIQNVYKSIINVTNVTREDYRNDEQSVRSNINESRRGEAVYGTTSRNPSEEFRSLNEISLPNETTMIAFDNESDNIFSAHENKYRFVLDERERETEDARYSTFQQQQQLLSQPTDTRDLGNIINEIRTFNSARLKNISEKIEPKIYQPSCAGRLGEDGVSVANASRNRQRINEINISIQLLFFFL
jgi:hypothetical protein